MWDSQTVSLDPWPQDPRVCWYSFQWNMELGGQTSSWHMLKISKPLSPSWTYHCRNNTFTNKIRFQTKLLIKMVIAHKTYCFTCMRSWERHNFSLWWSSSPSHAHKQLQLLFRTLCMLSTPAVKRQSCAFSLSLIMHTTETVQGEVFIPSPHVI